MCKQMKRKVYPLHRLDRGTSGNIVFAYETSQGKNLHEAMHNSESVKEYLVCCHGGGMQFKLIVETPLRKKKSEKFQPACSEFTRICEFSTDNDAHKITLLFARIKTGRTHQIRRHLLEIGHPVVGDTKYGAKENNTYFKEVLGLQRIFLHSYRLLFLQPISKVTVNVKNPLPIELVDFFG